MNKYKLGRLYLDNFKSFKAPILFDFREKDLLLFDGPNGFGKTTVFDAIEICFKGRVERFTPLDSKNKNQHPLKNDSDKETVICLEFLDGDNHKCSIFVNIPVQTTAEHRKKGRGLRDDY